MTSESRRYFAEDFASVGEHERLAVLEGNYDPGTFRLLENCGVATGLEVRRGRRRSRLGGGLARRRGGTGRVGRGARHRHLASRSSRASVERGGAPARHRRRAHRRCELRPRAHATRHRAPSRRRSACSRCWRSATRPGGVLVVECTDMLATAAADQSDPRSRAFDEFMAMSFAAVESMSTFDFGFARRLPRLFDALGFDASGSQVVGRVARGGDSKALEYALPVRRHAVRSDRAGTHDGGRDRRVPGLPRRPRLLVRGEQRRRRVGPATRRRDVTVCGRTATPRSC